jgi:hypothetical protein
MHFFEASLPGANSTSKKVPKAAKANVKIPNILIYSTYKLMSFRKALLERIYLTNQKVM